MFATANVTFLHNKSDTFSVFYGQDFDDDHKHVLPPGVIALKNLTDLTQKLPFTQSEEDVMDIFEKIYQDQSGVSVFEVVNTVWILRAVL